MLLKIKELKNLKENYINLLETKEKKYKDNIMMIYLESESSLELMESVNNILESDVYNLRTFLDFQFFVAGYDLRSEEKITNTQQIAIDINLIEMDDDGNIIETEHDILERYEMYKKIFIYND